jgi:hypothetical protein
MPKKKKTERYSQKGRKCCFFNALSTPTCSDFLDRMNRREYPEGKYKTLIFSRNVSLRDALRIKFICVKEK